MEVPFFKLEYDDAALQGVKECLESGWLTTGKKTLEFEQRFIRFLSPQNGSPLYALAVNSCTAALHLALEAIGLRKGEIVLVPTFTFAATAEVVRYFDATPVFVDVEPETHNISVSHLRETLETLRAERPLPGVQPPYGNVRAVIPVHYGGQPCDMEGVRSIAAEYGIDVIEDAAHAFPAGWLMQSGNTGDAAVTENGNKLYVGNGTSRITCFSFYANKTITTGEGGMALTADPALAERMRVMSLHGMDKDAWKRFTATGSWDYRLIAPGFKYNMTDIASAIGLAQLTRAEEYRLRRKRIVALYDEGLQDNPYIAQMRLLPGVFSSYHLYVIKLDTDALAIDRAAFIDELLKRDIKCSVHWRPLHMHPYYKETYGYNDADFPKAEAIWHRIVTLPLFPAMTDEQIAHVIHSVNEITSLHHR